jgi:class 3 adenylate cyclase
LSTLFVKEIGDAVLFIFQHFPDVLHWRAPLGDHLAVPFHQSIQIRSCVHIGEVSLQGVNPLSLAVSQCFKMEKKVAADDVVLTDPAYHVAWPTLSLAYSAFADYGTVELDGFAQPVQLHVVEAHEPAAFRELAVGAW